MGLYTLLFYDFVVRHRLRKPIGLCCFVVANVPVRANCFEFRTRLGSGRARSRVANWIVGIQANTTLSDYCVGRSRASRSLQVSAFDRREIEESLRELCPITYLSR
jgi:hypothetical protein